MSYSSESSTSGEVISKEDYSETSLDRSYSDEPISEPLTPSSSPEPEEEEEEEEEEPEPEPKKKRVSRKKYKSPSPSHTVTKKNKEKRVSRKKYTSPSPSPQSSPSLSPPKRKSKKREPEIMSKTVTKYWRRKTYDNPKILDCLEEDEKLSLENGEMTDETLTKLKMNSTKSKNPRRRQTIWKNKIRMDPSILERFSDNELEEYTENGLTDSLMNKLINHRKPGTTARSKRLYWERKLEDNPEAAEQLGEDEIEDLLENGSRSQFYSRFSYYVRRIKKN